MGPGLPLDNSPPTASAGKTVPSREGLRIAYLFTTFPKSTETFLQREIIAMQERGVHLHLFSLWGGGGEFQGLPVRAFPKVRLLELVWVIPWIALSRWDVFGIILRGLFTRRPPSFLNFWENMLGAGFAGLFRHELRRLAPDLIHAAWAGAPATAAWMLGRFNGHRYSTGAHAYDLYEHGGDWWLVEKLAEARFIHTSTAMGRDTMVARGVDASKIHVIRRGLERFPAVKPLRTDRSILRLLCIARLVEKKGLFHQLRIHAALRDAGVAFEARIIGEGPLAAALAAERERLHLGTAVQFLGHQPQARVWQELTWADVLLHTGIVAASGDRDGLPNVIPEAMSIGTIVCTSPAAATREAVQDGVSGRVLPVERPADWVEALRGLQTSDPSAEGLRREARAWVEREYNAHVNAGRLHALFVEAVEHP